MNIGIDGTPVWGPQVGQYTYMVNLISSMLQLETDNNFNIYCRREIPSVFPPPSNQLSYHIASFKNRKFCEQLSIPWHAIRNKPDVLHMCWGLPLYYPGKTVVTVHGAEFWSHPDIQIHSSVNALYYKFSIGRSARKATRLIAVSEFIKSVLVENMQIPEEKVDVVHHGVNQDFFYVIDDSDKLQAVRSKYKLPERFVLFVGAMVANKNLERLLQAYKGVLEQSDLQDVGMVIVGGQAWNSEPLQLLIKELGIEDRVVFTGFVPEEDINALYNLATVYAFPSLVEGFGLPVLEAFASGAPVVTSNVSAMAEVAGDAGLLIDPLSSDDLADALIKVLSNDALRQSLIERGLQKAAKFSWNRTARKTMDVYKRAALG